MSAPRRTDEIVVELTKVVCFLHYERNADHLAALVRSLTSSAREVLLVLVRNDRMTPMAMRFKGNCRSEQVVEVAYDGRHWEFGAYQLGLDHARRHGGTTPVTFFNDTAGRNYPLRAKEIRALRRFTLERRLGNGNAAMGHVEIGPPGLTIQGQPVTAWIRSNAFVLSTGALAALGNRLFVPDVFFGPEYSNGKLEMPEWVSPDLRRYVLHWLTDTGKHGWRAHAGMPALMPRVLRDKAGSILLEKRLAALVAGAGGEMLSYSGDITRSMLSLSEKWFYLMRRFERWHTEKWPRKTEHHDK